MLKPDQTLYRTDGSFGLDHQNFPDADKLKANVVLVKTHGGKPYQAELQDGFDFTKPGLPSFITSITGVSFYEPTGRWSDATTNPEVVLEFSSNLPDQFTLAIEAGAFGPNINADTKVVVGDQQRSIVVTSADSALYCLSFDKVKDTNKLVIKPASPTSPASLQMGDDQRLLGIAFKSLKILEQTDASRVCTR